MFSWFGASLMAIAGFLASLCNEYTGVWLFAIVGSSLLARHYFGQELQVRHHILIAVMVLAGLSIVLLAPGNSVRIAAAGGLRIRELGFWAPRVVKYILIDLGHFLLSPPVISWALVAAVVALTEPPKPVNPRGGLLALGIMAVCLSCCYFEYLTAQLSTGAQLVERAQNQTLILFSFGLTLSIVLLVKTYRQYILDQLSFMRPVSLNSAVLPAGLGCIFAASLYASAAASQIVSQREAFNPFRQESLDRNRLLTTSQDSTVALSKHKWKPPPLFGDDIDMSTGCLASYYGKAIEIVPVAASVN